MMAVVSRGFGRGRRRGDANLPPGQYLVDDFPVLSAGPTPRVPLDRWRLTVTTETGAEHAWSWPELLALPAERFTVDLHCVTKWSKLDTTWEGVPLDTLLDDVETAADYALVDAYGGYATNPAARRPVRGTGVDGVSVRRRGAGAGARRSGAAAGAASVPVWKSAKWVRRIRLLLDDKPGFWESAGYHMYGDPWREQRY